MNEHNLLVVDILGRSVDIIYNGQITDSRLFAAGSNITIRVPGYANGYLINGVLGPSSWTDGDGYTDIPIVMPDTDTIVETTKNTQTNYELTIGEYGQDSYNYNVYLAGDLESSYNSVHGGEWIEVVIPFQGPIYGAWLNGNAVTPTYRNGNTYIDFFMPYRDARLYFSYDNTAVPQPHSVTVTETNGNHDLDIMVDGGSILNGDNVFVGSDVTVTTTGEISSITLNGEPWDNWEEDIPSFIYFEMPNTNAVLNIIYVLEEPPTPPEPESYQITVTLTNGTESYTLDYMDGANAITTQSGAYVAEGSTMHLYIGDPENSVESITVNGTTLQVNYESGVYSITFTMPSLDTTIAITYTIPAPPQPQSYSLTIQQTHGTEDYSVIAGGSIVNDLSSIAEGTSVTVQVVEPTNAVNSITLNGTSQTVNEASDVYSVTFTMPSLNSTVVIDYVVPTPPTPVTSRLTVLENGGNYSPVVMTTGSLVVQNLMEIEEDTPLVVSFNPGQQLVSQVLLNNSPLEVIPQSGGYYIVLFNMPATDASLDIYYEDPTPTHALTVVQLNGSHNFTIWSVSTNSYVANGSQVQEGDSVTITIPESEHCRFHSALLNDVELSDVTNEGDWVIEFTMPNTDAEITLSYVPTYSLQVTQTNGTCNYTVSVNGNVVLDTSSIYRGDTVRVTMTNMSDGIDEVRLNVNSPQNVVEQSDTAYVEFTMPDQNSVVNIVFVPRLSYLVTTVTYGGECTWHCSVDGVPLANNALITEGDLVTFSVDSASNDVEQIKVNSLPVTVNVNNGVYLATFTMPQLNTTISVILDGANEADGPGWLRVQFNHSKTYDQAMSLANEQPGTIFFTKDTKLIIHNGFVFGISEEDLATLDRAAALDLGKFATRVEVTEGLTAEQTARETVAAALQAAIEAEASARSSADDTLQGLIADEETRATTAEGVLLSAIEQEVSDRLSAIATEVSNRNSAISSAINTEVSNRNTAIETAVNAEQTRATAAELANAADIDAIEAKIPEQATAQNQLADKGFVTSATAAVQTNLDTEISNRTSADSTLLSNIDAEASTRSSADTTLQTNITAEETRATNAEAAINEKIPQAASSSNKLTDKAYVDNIQSTLSTAVSDEATARLSADTTLLNNIDAEASARSSAVSNEASTRASADTTLQGNIDSEASTRSSEISRVEGLISSEASRAGGVESGLDTRLSAAEGKIPSAATSSNQLADKAFVNSSIATSTATFRGTVTSTSNLPSSNIDENDYAFVTYTDAAGNTKYDRYKYTAGQWEFEYTLNNSSFTADQWATIQSGLTSSYKTKVDGIESGAQVHRAPTTSEVHTALGTGSGTSKYLREDGTWVTPPNDNTWPSYLSQLTNDVGYITSYSDTVTTINGHTGAIPASDIAAVLTAAGYALTDTDTNTWRPITNDWSGTDQSTSLSQYGARDLYNTLVNGYASSAGHASSADSATSASSASYATYASYVTNGDNAASPGGALLQSGTGRADSSPSGDTWLFLDSMGGTSSPWGIRHQQADNNIEYFGAGSITSYVNLSNGVNYGYGYYHRSYGSSAYALTSDGGVAHIGSMSVNYANSAGSAPASDVYSWAKQSTKPTYTAAEVGALRNYGEDNSRPSGTTFILPGGANVVLMRSGATGGADIGIFQLSDDNAFVCNSSDNGYLFAAFDTDRTADFSTPTTASFAVLSDGAGATINNNTVMHSGNVGSYAIANLGGDGGSIAGFYNTAAGNQSYYWGFNGSSSNTYAVPNSSMSVGYASSSGNSDTVDGEHASAFVHKGGDTMTGWLYGPGVAGSSTSDRLVFRYIDGQDCSGDHSLYLQYYTAANIMFGNNGYGISSNGSYYNGTAAAASNADTVDGSHASEFVYKTGSRMSGRLDCQNASTGEYEINPNTYALMVGPGGTRIGGYMPGIAFNHMLNYQGGTGYDGSPGAWIGIKLYDTPGSERSTLVFATKPGTGTSNTGNDIPIERMSIDPFGTIYMKEALVIQAHNNYDNYNEGIRIQDAPNYWAGITFGADGNTGCSSSQSNAWFAAKNPSGLFIISPNASSSSVGLTLNSGGNAYWRDNVIIHSGNIGNYAITSHLDISGKVDKTSSSRPGVYRLYRRDDESAYNLLHHWTGSYWYLRGYYNDDYHAGVQVDYANLAANNVEKLDWWVDTDSHNVDDLVSGVTFAYSSHNAPTTGVIASFTGTHNSYQLQLQGQYAGEHLFFRNKNGDNGTWNPWRYVIHNGNIGSQSVSYATSAGSASSASYATYAGYIVKDAGLNAIFRENSSYRSGIYYSTPGNESVVFANNYNVTSWMFATTNPDSCTDWTTLTPSLQIKNQQVAINKQIPNGGSLSYNLDVNGSANATTLYENGSRVITSSNIGLLTVYAAGFADQASNSVHAEKWGNYSLSVVSSMPASPDQYTIYIVV